MTSVAATPGFSKVYSATSEYVADSTQEAVEFYQNSMAPAINSAAKATVRLVDDKCTRISGATVEFLTKHPGIAMVVSSNTVFRMATANHVSDLMGKSQATAATAVVTN